MRAFSLDLQVPTTPGTGQAVTCHYLSEKVVQVHTLASGLFQIEIATDGIHYQEYGDAFSATGFLHIPLFARSMRVRCVEAGSASMVLSGVRQ